MFGGSAPDGYENAVTEILFSRENIDDSKRRNTSYIGKAMNDKNERAIRDKSEIVKSREEIQQFKLQERVFYRKDGTKILAEKLETQQMNGRTLHKYQLYEMIKDGKIESVRSYIVYSELDLIKTTNVYNCYSEDQAMRLIEDAKQDTSCKVEHSIKYKAKKDRKTGEIVEEIWTCTITKKFEN
jgi:hypothetical protein